MAETIYKTNDGQEFSNRGEAQRHANSYAQMKADEEFVRWSDIAMDSGLNRNWDAAIQANTRLMALDPTSDTFYQNRAEAYFNSGRTDLAFADARQYAARTGRTENHAIALLYMERAGKYYLEDHDLESAYLDYKEAMRLDPSRPKSLLNDILEAKPELETNPPTERKPLSRSVSHSSASASSDTGEPQAVGLFTRVLQVGAFLIAGAVGGGIIAFVASWFFGKATLSTEFIRVAANVVTGVIGYRFAADVLISNPRPQDTAFSKKLLTILIIGGTVFFLGNSKLPPPLTTVKRIMGIESVKPAAAQTSTVQTATVTAEALNLRAEASGGAALVKTIKKGETLNVTGAVQSGWAPVEHGGDTGWVSAQYLKMAE